jgi:hypothetical protein
VLQSRVGLERQSRACHVGVSAIDLGSRFL